MYLNKVSAALVAAGLSAPGLALATNGMDFEGYGPISAAMGGASMAFENGTGAMMNNPATMGLMAEGNRLDVALGFLGPNVTSKMTGMADAKSGGDAYFMPAAGWIKKTGKLLYGVGLYAQGGMGTEYNRDSLIAMPTGEDTGDGARSELGVGRVILPLAYEVRPEFIVGGSLDVVWAMMDLKMAVNGEQMSQMVQSCAGLPCGLLPSGAGDWLRLDFSDDNDYTGKAKGYGLAGKIGFVYKASPALTVGGSYHTRTWLNDLETTDSGASFTIEGMGAMPGKITVRDFQWPDTFGLGLAYTVSDKTMLAADVKYIRWAQVMKDFKMGFSNPAINASFRMPQAWDNQTVLNLGIAHKATDALTLRAGFNRASNPVPGQYMNPLFPAIVEEHYTVGFSYAISKQSDWHFSLMHAPKVSQTNGSGVTVEHGQTNWGLMYSYRF